ncbi:MAG: pseudouridine synthase [Sphingobium sp.]|nr:pseudouridine synthase [Sphingobium sp.]
MAGPDKRSGSGKSPRKGDSGRRAAPPRARGSAPAAPTSERAERSGRAGDARQPGTLKARPAGRGREDRDEGARKPERGARPVRRTGERGRPSSEQEPASTRGRSSASERRQSDEGRRDERPARPARNSEKPRRAAGPDAQRRTPRNTPQGDKRRDAPSEERPAREPMRNPRASAMSRPAKLSFPAQPRRAGDETREGQRIAKLLARAGVASRREIERMIAEGRIARNGEPIETPATVLKSLHGVTVDGIPVHEPAPARLFRFHKPRGLLTTERDPRGRRTIYDALPEDLPRVMPVGRLDLNTEGLLLLTTDGELKRQMELPSTGVERTYRARAYGEVSQAQLEDLFDGIEIDGVRYGRIEANLERRTGRNQWIEMTLTEGKNREVRRVLEHMGLEVSRLIRTRYGPFLLEDMPEGAVDEIRRHDLVVFRNSLG